MKKRPAKAGFQNQLEFMRIDRTGKKYQRWTVVSFAEIRYLGKDNQPKAYWNCVCECGTERIIEGNLLVQKQTTSCGCHRKEGPLYECKKHELWGVYRGMIDRCYYPKHRYYSYYGGRGIEVSEEFREAPAGFWNFVNYMGERPKGMTLDRINNDGPYARGNLRWATMLEQNRNRSGTHGWTNTPTYQSWKTILHKYYEKCDPAWRDSFLKFLEDMGEKPEGARLRRKDRNQGFNKENCYYLIT